MSIQEIIYDWESRAGFYSPEIPELQPLDINRFRLSLIKEEVAELESAIYQGNIVEVADALADIIWVVYGTAHAFGMDLDDLVREVARSNDTKLEGGPSYNRKGKLLKGDQYKPPEIEERLIQQTKRRKS